MISKYNSDSQKQKFYEDLIQEAKTLLWNELDFLKTKDPDYVKSVTYMTARRIAIDDLRKKYGRKYTRKSIEFSTDNLDIAQITQEQNTFGKRTSIPIKPDNKT